MKWARTWVKDWLLRHGAVLSRPPGQFALTSYKLGLAKDRGLRVEAAIDGGASNGSWTRELKALYPTGKVLCVEPRPDMQADLAQLARELPGIHIAPTLVGEREGVVEFHEHGNQSSMLPNSAGKAFGALVQRPMTTLDKLVQTTGVGLPDLIKLDLQGAELQALAGATQCLGHASAVLLEVSFMPLQKGQPLVGDVVAFLARFGFRCYDITALAHRPLDGALAQGDFIFVHERSGLIGDNRFAVGVDFS
jgi:FkbM family methyltransferase